MKPHILIPKMVSIEGNTLTIGNLKYDLAKVNNIFVTGAGKASALMASSMESILGDRIDDGHVITKYGHGVPLKYITLTEAGHPVPDEQGISGTEKIVSLAKKAFKGDLLVCLFSGGASSLMIDVPDGLKLSDIQPLNQVLLDCGADITEINCLRKHLSNVKGGRLAYMVSPADVVSLILSDVVGDRLDVIASGPTAPDPTSFTDALKIVEKYRISEMISSRILQFLNVGQQVKHTETPKPSDPLWHNVHNVVIGSNEIALNHATTKAEALGYKTYKMTHMLQGDVSKAASYILEAVKKFKVRHVGEKVCLLFGGEPTVQVKGIGMGGRNQHLALLIATLIADMKDVVFLSGGTDGTDGPTDVAGAVVDSSTVQRSKDLGFEIQKYIERFDSYNFFKGVGGHVRTGPTQTNVMDLMVVLMEGGEGVGE